MNTLEQLTQKIQTWEQIALTVAQWRAAGERIVFTNGCFDLLHYGHLHYAHRPINDEATRQTQLAALSFVDAVVSFSQDTPLELIERVQPDILVKGGDYVLENIVGAEFVLASGGVVRTLPFVSGYSTTNIEAKIKEGE
jgi:D-glycero-beta-D-manno-heptose 1-phosphate adenylyltransferase